MERRVAVGERGQQQRAIGDALRAGQRDAAVGACDRCQSDRCRRCCFAIIEVPRIARSGAQPWTAARGLMRVLARAGRQAASFARSAPGHPRERSGGQLRRPERQSRLDFAECLAKRHAFRQQGSRFASAMSRHISGELAAMRVKSRKPPAASAEQLAGVVARDDSEHEANASRCGRWLTAAKMRSCAPGVERDDARAAGLPESRRRAGSHPATFPRAASGHARPPKSAPSRRCRPRALAAGDRMPRNEAREVARQRRARGGDDILLGAADVGDDGMRSPVAARARRTTPRYCATGVATTTRSAPASSRVHGFVERGDAIAHAAASAASSFARVRVRCRRPHRPRLRVAARARTSRRSVRRRRRPACACRMCGTAPAITRASACASAARKRSFSAGRPTVTRRYSGSRSPRPAAR